MKEPMTRWGVGPIWALLSMLYGALSVITTRVFPVLQISNVFYPTLNYFGIVLLLIGIPYFILSVNAVTKAFNAKELVTSGVYGICRHPLYGSWIVFTVPGIALIMHSWLALVTPIVMYILLRILVTKEEDYLAEEFGESYLKYKSRIPFVSPTGWLRKQ